MLSVHVDEKFGGEVNGVFICPATKKEPGGIIPELGACAIEVHGRADYCGAAPLA